MEPLAADTVVALIARYAEHLAGAEAETAATGRLRRLRDTVAARFDGDPVAEGALRRLQDQPDNAKRRGAVEDHLQELAENDPEFAHSLATLLREAAEADGDTGTVRNDMYVKVDGPRIPAARPSVENG
ncbi:hypothetical protein ACFVZW_32845 [Streptomyces sp. NPDC059567]|uniref:hypothetical protein n=1 Tax=Streptomyces sp. NPDC059567 TaxID=3346867 RepID=UPI00367FD060